MKKILISFTLFALLMTSLGLIHLDASEETDLEPGDYYYLTHSDGTVGLYHKDSDTIIWENHDELHEWEYGAATAVDDNYNLYINSTKNFLLYKFDVNKNYSEINLDTSSFTFTSTTTREDVTTEFDFESNTVYKIFTVENSNPVEEFVSRDYVIAKWDLSTGELINSKRIHDTAHFYRTQHKSNDTLSTLKIRRHSMNLVDDHLVFQDETGSIYVYDKDLNVIDTLWTDLVKYREYVDPLDSPSFDNTNYTEVDYEYLPDFDYPLPEGWVNHNTFHRGYNSTYAEFTQNDTTYLMFPTRFIPHDETTVKVDIHYYNLTTNGYEGKTSVYLDKTLIDETYLNLPLIYYKNDSLILTDLGSSEFINIPDFIPFEAEINSTAAIDVTLENSTVTNHYYNDTFIFQYSSGAHLHFLNDMGEIEQISGYPKPFDENEWTTFVGFESFNVEEPYIPVSVDGASHITKNASFITSGSFFLNHVSALDDQNNDISNQLQIITNEYQGNAATPGEYHVELALRDDEDNILLTHDLTIEVKEDIHPLYIVDNAQWFVDKEHEMTQSNVMDTLKALDVINNESHAYTELANTYSDNFNEEGTYQLQLELLSASGIDYNLDYEIEVIDGSQVLTEQSLNPLALAVEYWKITLTVIGIIAVTVYIKKK